MHKDKHDFPRKYESELDYEGRKVMSDIASNVKDDFDNMPTVIQEILVGRPKPEAPTNLTPNPTLEYYDWLSEGRAIWRVRQANDLIKEINKNENS
jgi:hypothetical protein